MRWTFDPLQSRNAYVNFSKLGVVCREYVERHVRGDGFSPPRGVGTDRLVAIWDMDFGESGNEACRRAEVAHPWRSCPDVPQLLPVITKWAASLPRGRRCWDWMIPVLLLAVPGAIDAMMEDDMPLAIRWREATREAFLHYFSRGYEVREFIRGGGATRPTSLVGPGEGR